MSPRKSVNLYRVLNPSELARQLSHGKRIGIEHAIVGLRLSQMILDKVFHGVLDQEKGRLIVYDEPTEDVSPRGIVYFRCACSLIALSNV